MTEEQRAQQADAINRIRKLLALSTSPNEAEAALAAARVQELLVKHNLTMGVVEDADQQKAERRASESLGTRIQPHLWVLAEACQSMFDVRYYVTRFFIETPGWRYSYEKKIVFIGLPANVETALLTLAYLRGAIDAILKGRLREGAVHGVSEARDYKLGAAQRIQQTITSEKRRINMADSETTALIHLSRQIAEAAYKALNIRGSLSMNMGARDADAYSLGRTDGGRINPYAARSNSRR